MITNEFGTFQITTDKQPTAGGFASVEFILKPADGFIMHPRTMIEIVQFTRFYSNQFSLPQTNDPTAPGYVIAKRSDGKFVDVVIRRIPAAYFRHGSTYHVIQLTLGEAPLEKGVSIKVVYGFKGAGSPGTQCPPLAKYYSFPVFISQRHVLGGQRFLEEKAISFDSLFVNKKNVSTNDVKNSAAFNPTLKVEGGSPEKLKIIVSPREESGALITVNATDIHGNISKAANGIVEINEVKIVELKEGYGHGYIKIMKNGVQRLIGTCRELNMSAMSNPFIMGEKVAWGEIHSHSGISDGLGTDKENYMSAIKAGLDFGALSDHDTLMEKDRTLWDVTKENAEKYSNEPEFITLLGYESLAYREGNIAGHINIYYPGADGPMDGRPELEQIAKICKENEAIAIPHHTMYGGPFFEQMGMKMEYMEPDMFPDNIMPVAEIYSTHGCSETEGCERSVLGVKAERSVNAALIKGFKWGFIGGSDNHESLLGHHFRVDKIPRTINNEHMQFRHGLTAAYVSEFSRNGIFKAIKKKSVYATTGERILISFDINGKRMGNTLDYRNEGIFITANVSGTTVVSGVHIIKNGEVLSSRCPNALDCEISYVDESPVKAGTYYYLKVVQADGEMAWSSPIWIDVG